MDGEAPYERWEIGSRDPGGEPRFKSQICPRRLVTNATREWLGLYSHYVNGHLFCAGGISSQPAIYLKAMNLISALKAEALEDE